jgi:bifunctional DNA-binding transcriptional regulator/antitoxin component of YhaV-PrlF toxin-antitoxin module
MISTVRVQEKGLVTIPRKFRRQLNLKKVIWLPLSVQKMA